MTEVGEVLSKLGHAKDSFLNTIAGTPEQRAGWKLAGRINYGMRLAPFGAHAEIVVFSHPLIGKKLETRVIKGDIADRPLKIRLRYLSEQLSVAADELDTNKLEELYSDLFNMSEKLEDKK